MQVLRITHTTDLVNNNILCETTRTEIIEISDVENKLKDEKIRKSILDTIEILDEALKINVTNDISLNKIREICTNQFKQVALKRNINESTARANVIRNNNLESTEKFYSNILLFLLNKDLSLRDSLLKIAKNNNEKNLILKTFNLKANY